MPSFPTLPNVSIVFSMFSFTRPSPDTNVFFSSSASSNPRIAASSAEDIFAAHDAFAPSHTIPPTEASVFVIESEMIEISLV